MSFTAKFRPNPRLRKRIKRARDAAAEAVVAEVLKLAKAGAPRDTGELAGSATGPKLIGPGRARGAFTAPYAKAVHGRQKFLGRQLARSNRRALAKVAARAFRRSLRRG